MNQVDDDLILLWFGLAFLHLRKLSRTKRRFVRKERVNPYLLERAQKGNFAVNVSTRAFLQNTIGHM
jgi:hypothetical protein